uniref:KIN14B-interacting protein At4g14310 n=1 Tax=Erigeron canadensis TaxID=72917 RepID=UPI001CB95FB7|nr:KIN14B-interacting protein At4g14310 [Erigeron canadensis]
MSSTTTTRRPKQPTTAADASGGARKPNTTAGATNKSRSTTPINERTIYMSTGKENPNTCRPGSRIRAAASSKPQKPIVPPIVRSDKDRVEPRARWGSNCPVRPRGRSSSPSEFSRVSISSDLKKTRGLVDRNERSVSVGRSNRVSVSGPGLNRVGIKEKVGGLNVRNEKRSELCNGVEKRSEICNGVEKRSEICDGSKPKNVKSQNEENVKRESSIGSDSVMKVSESVKLFEKFKSKSCVGLKSSNGVEKEVSGSEEGLSVRSSGKYPSKLHGKLAFLEEKVKRIASDIKRTKEMLDLNNPDASKVMLSDIQETVAGIEKAMGDVVGGENEKTGSKMNGSDSELSSAKSSTNVSTKSGSKSLGKGLNTDELEARFFPHHKLLRDRSALKAPSGSNESVKTEVDIASTEKKNEKHIGQELSCSLSKVESKVTSRGGLEISEVQETDDTVSSKSRDASNTYSVKGNVDTMLAADETLEEFDEKEIKEITVFEMEMDDGYNNQLNEIGHKTCTGGWFVSEGESALLVHDDGSCTFYDVANSEDKSIYKAPTEAASNLWRDCWIVRAPGADGCAGRYVVAASAGNSIEAGFCSWDFYTKEVKSFHTEDGVTNTRTALAPLSNNALNRRHDLTNLTPENRQWWYKPCGPLIISTASNQKALRIYDVRDGEHIMKWELQNCVSAMENSSPLQWRNRGKVVVAETEIVSLWDVGSLTPEPLHSVSSAGKKVSALHINNTDAELGGGVRQRVSSSEAEGNDGVFCTSDSINVLDFRHPSGIGIKIPKHSSAVHSVFSRGDSIYLGCSGSSSSVKKPTSTSQIQQFSIRKQKLFSTYSLPESNAHPHYKAITQVWGNSDLTMGVCSLGLYVFDALKDDDMKPYAGGYGSDQKVRETIGPDNLYCPSFDYLGSRALLISRDRPAVWKYLS